MECVLVMFIFLLPTVGRLWRSAASHTTHVSNGWCQVSTTHVCYKQQICACGTTHSTRQNTLTGYQSDVYWLIKDRVPLAPGNVVPLAGTERQHDCMKVHHQCQVSNIGCTSNIIPSIGQHEVHERLNPANGSTWWFIINNIHRKNNMTHFWWLIGK